MCVAGLNVCTQPCSHRWYELLRACSDERDLSNCPRKLQLEGWETRKEMCPWCDSSGDNDEPITTSTHRLFGSTSSASSSSSTSSSPVISAMNTKPQLMRCGSDGALSTLSRTGSFSSTGSERGQMHRDRNDRLRLYLTMLPHEVLPSAGKYYPSSATSPKDMTPPSSDSGSIKSTKNRLGAGWRKSVRFGRSVFAS
ncbi:hypothetical protein Q7P37_003455 [Cladosporium fusiforme]